jgi:cobalamin biosynthesis protein CobC
LSDFDAPSHGGRLQEARRLFPDAPEPFIDLSTGINPLPYPVPSIEPSVWARLPEPEQIGALEDAAAKAYGVADANMVTAVPGTQLLISLLPRVFPQSSVAILGPTYGEYARAFAAAGSVVDASALGEIANVPCVVLCNPNNPDGRRFDAAELLEFARRRAGKGMMLVDESFVDLDDQGLSLASHLPQPSVLLLRSLSKSYGLGGLRLGFALANSHLAASIRAALGPWPVSGPAVEIGIKALDDRAWLLTAKERLTRDVRRLDGLLRRAGLAIVGGTLLFRLAEFANAPALFQRLGQLGILVRTFDRRPDWLRFGTPGSAEAWQRLAEALSITPASSHSD